MTDLGDNNDSKTIPLCEEERLVNEAKIFALSAIKDWIEKITGKYFLYPKDFRKSLADGILLCNLLNTLKPGSIKRINKISTAISGYDNLSKFLQCCEDDFGLSPQVLFKISDLEDLSEKFPDSQLDSEKRIERVLLCLFHLAKSVEDQYNQVTLDSRPFTSLLKGRDIREMRKIKSHSMSEDSVFESSVPEMIHRQTPNYLANKAHQTLEQTKQNQNILHKTIENDDWQESLQNWREKRRQVLSSSVAEHINTDFDTYDSSELVKLKEKARKMKQLRDQIKDQNLQSNHDLTASQENASIPDIDAETKAMIERLKQKKLDEENKRQFLVSSPNTMSFASDSDLSNSLSMNKRNSTSLSKKPDSVPVVPLSSIHNDGDNIESNHITTKDYDKTDTIKPGKTRTFTVKLNQRSKQDSEQLWGMDIIEKSEMILVSKVKIGSSADVCEIRKDDEIISINSVLVAKQSVDYAKSVFKKMASVLSPSEYITLTLKRSITEDDFDDEDGDEEFTSENMSENLDDNPFESKGKAEVDYDKNLDRNKFGPGIANNDIIRNQKKDFNEFQSPQSVLVEKINKPFAHPNKNNNDTHPMEKPKDKESPTIPSISNEQSELSKKILNSETLRKDRLQYSIIDKIAKFESQNILNSSVASLSLNASKNSLMDSSFKNTKYNHQSSCEGLNWNPGGLTSNPLGISNSSISNSTHDLETEPNNSISLATQNMIARSAPFIPMPINSSIGVKSNVSSMELETAEENPDTSNINIAHTWKRIPSSDNSSTSDDVSALNETVIVPQYSYNSKLANSKFQNQEKTNNVNDDNHRVLNKQSDSAPKSDSIDIRFHSNVSTGIQTNLISNRPSTAYTTITTSFEKKYRLSYSNTTSKVSDEDSYSVSTESKPENFHSKFPWQNHNFMNEVSKDLTAVSTIANEIDDQMKLEKTSSLSFGSNTSDINKPVEIEVSVTPQLFPMRNKSLFSKTQNEKQLNHKTNDSIILDPSFDEDETTLNAITYDEVMSPNKEENIITSAIAKVLGSSQKDEKTDSEVMKIDDSQFSFPNSKTDDRTKRRKSNGKSESNIETDQSFSTAPAPTLFNGDQNLDSTLSLGISHSKSENINSLKKETDNSSKNSKKNISKNSAGTGSRQSTSTKDLRVPERINKTESLKPNKDNKESTSRSSSSKRNTYTPTQSQVTFSNVVQDVTHTKSQNKSYSIDKSARNTPVTSTSNDKKKQKSKNRKSSQAEISTKCSSCSQPAGSEDLMVIEELKLHFHLRCFFCSECKIQLGDGKTDTDVRIRRSKLHCATCFDKKSSKPKIRNPFASRQHKSASGSNQSKGGHGDGFNACIKPCDSNNNFSFSPAIASLSSPFVINNSSVSLNPSVSLQ